MFATITTTGQTFPIESKSDGGYYLRVMGHARFFAAHLVTLTA